MGTRLNKQMKEVFARNVVADLPDPDEVLRNATKFVQAEVNKTLPPQALELLGTDPGRLNSMSLYAEGIYVTVVGVPYGTTVKGVLDEEATTKLEQMVAEYESRRTARHKLRAELQNSISKITTVEALLKLYPELEKYIPASIKPVDNLPATNIMAKLVSAGWPVGAQA